MESSGVNNSKNDIKMKIPPNYLIQKYFSKYQDLSALCYYGIIFSLVQSIMIYFLGLTKTHQQVSGTKLLSFIVR